jgi:hypothetical protein
MIIIATLMLLFGGGNSLDMLADRVNVHVTDLKRANQITEIIVESENTVLNYENQAKEIGQKIVSLNADYSATDDQYYALMDQVYKNYEDAAREFLDNRFKIRSLMTREEWEAVTVPAH